MCFASRLRFHYALVACASIIFGSFLFPKSALAICASPFTGMWLNLKQNDDPGAIQVYFDSCGDTSNSETRLAVRVWVRQSNGQWYGRPPVYAHSRIDKGTEWLFAKVPTGGYVDKIWLRNNKGELAAFIINESLDGKPSAQGWHLYKRK